VVIAAFFHIHTQTTQYDLASSLLSRPISEHTDPRLYGRGLNARHRL